MSEYIDRNALYEHIKTFANLVEQLRPYTVLGEIRTFPAADVEAVKRAKWAWYPDYMDRYELHCTNCEEECPYDADGKYLDAKYCPHCGAKLEE